MMRLTLVLLILGCAPLVAAEAPVRDFRIPSLYHVGFWVRDIAKSRAFYKDFLGYEEPYVLNRPDGTLQLVIMKVNERQVIYLFPNAAKILPNGDNLDHLGLETDNIAAVRERLLAHGVNVGQVGRGRIGDLLLGVKDPDGSLFEMTQFAPEGQLMKHQGKSLAPERVSSRLLSASIAVTDLPAALHFYRDILGFRPIRNGRNDGEDWVRLQVPDGADYLDLLPYLHEPGTERRRAVPDFCLEVPDAAKTAEILTARAKALGLPPPAPVSLARDGRRQTSCVDPDGTRVIFKEPEKHPSAK